MCLSISLLFVAEMLLIFPQHVLFVSLSAYWDHVEPASHAGFRFIHVCISLLGLRVKMPQTTCSNQQKSPHRSGGSTSRIKVSASRSSSEASPGASRRPPCVPPYMLTPLGTCAVVSSRTLISSSYKGSQSGGVRAHSHGLILT